MPIPVALITTLAPYVVDALGLVRQYVEVLTNDDPSLEDMKALKARFEESQRRRDEALDGLKAAIEAKRQNG